MYCLMNKEVAVYEEVLKNCLTGNPVFLAKKERIRFMVFDVEDYERYNAEIKLLIKLQEAEEDVKNGNGWLSLDELKEIME